MWENHPLPPQAGKEQKKYSLLGPLANILVALVIIYSEA